MGVPGVLVYCSDYRCSHTIAISGRETRRTSDSLWWITLNAPPFAMAKDARLSWRVGDQGMQTDAKRNERRQQRRGDYPTTSRLPRVRRDSRVSRPRDDPQTTQLQTRPKMGPHGMQSVPTP